MGINNVAVIYPSLPQRYQSYGDHWFDAIVDYHGAKNVECFDIMSGIKDGFDLYFFIEALPLWFELPKDRFRPRVLYCWDSHLNYFCYIKSLCNHFDRIYLANRVDAERLKAYGMNVKWIPPGYNRILHRPLGLMKKWDVGFIGQQDDIIRRYPGSATRKECLMVMASVFGDSCFIGQGFYGEDYVRILNECKVILDYRTHFEIGARFYEALGMGVPILTQLFESDLKPDNDIYPVCSCLGFTEGEDVNGIRNIFEYIKERSKDGSLDGWIEAYVADQQRFLESHKVSYTDRYAMILEDMEKNRVTMKKVVFDLGSEKKPLPENVLVTRQAEVVIPNLDLEDTDSKIRFDIRHKIGVVIPTKFSIPTIANTVRQISESVHILGMNCKIVVVKSKGDNKYYISQQMFLGKALSDEETKSRYMALKDIVFLDAPDKIEFTSRVNMGLRELLKDEEVDYIMVCNDDIVFAQDAIKNMLSIVINYEYDLVGPISNCDKGWQHDIKTGITDNHGLSLLEFGIGQSYHVFGEQMEREIFSHYSSELLWDDIRLHKSVPWVAAYCWMTRRDVFETYGLLNEKMRMVCSDEEFCKRLLPNRVGYCFDAFVFHYGAITRKTDEKRSYDEYHKIDKEDNEYRTRLAATSCEIKNIVFYSGPSWERWGYGNIAMGGGGIGGSEACQLHLAAHLADLGYNVHMYYDWDRKSLSSGAYGANVASYKYEDFNVGLWDSPNTCVVYVRQPHRAKEDGPRKCIKLLWNHDVCYHYDKKWYEVLAASVDKIINISCWHKSYWVNEFGVNPNDIRVINDGISPNFIGRKTPTDKNTIPRLIYASSYDRGLDIIMNVLSEVKHDLVLNVYYGTDNLKKWIEQENNDQLCVWLSDLEKQMVSDGRVVKHIRIGEIELFDQFLRSDLWFYPTYFHETYCITALMAQASETHIITRPLAALRETVGDRAYGMIDGNVYLKDVQDKFKKRLESFLSDWDLQEGLSMIPGFGLAVGDGVDYYVQRHSWNVIAEQWIETMRLVAHEKD